MANLTQIKFFRVPFDNSYKKVFDINSIEDNGKPKTIFYNLLDKYTSYTISPNIINIKRYNNRIIFTVKDSAEKIRPYNYLAISYDTDIYFYFVTDIVSENDNSQIPSTTVTAEWDAWHNNLNDIYDYSNDLVDMNKIIYGHRNIYKDYNGELRQIPYRNTDERMFTKKDEIFTYNTPDLETHDIGNIVKILWLKLTVTDEFFTTYNKDLDVEQNISVESLPEKYILDTARVEWIKGFRPITNSNFTNIIYIPYGVFYKGENIKATIKTNPIGNINQYPKCVYKQGSESRTDIFSFPLAEYEIEKIPVLQDIYANIYRITNESGMTDYITTIELTYYSPYRYTYVYYEATKDIDINFYAPMVKINNFFVGNNDRPIITFGYGDKIEIKVKDKPITETEIAVIYNFSHIYYDNDDNKNYYNDIYNSYYFEFVKNYKIDLRESYMGHGVSHEVYRNENSGGIIEPQINLFPYSYYTIYYNGDEYILQVPIKEYSIETNSNLKSEYRIEIHMETSQPFIKLYFNDKPLFNGNIFLKNSGLVSYSKDASASYSIRNGAQDITSIALKTIASGVSGGYVGAIMSGVSGIASLTAKYYDLSKTPDTPQHSTRSEDDIYIQDDIKIYKNTYIDEQIGKEKLKKCYIYGYDFICYDSIFKNNRFWWDYKKTENCMINSLIRNDDKAVIERMFNNGVHMFHINYGNGKYYYDKFMEFDENVYWNIDKDIAVYN